MSSEQYFAIDRNHVNYLKCWVDTCCVWIREKTVVGQDTIFMLLDTEDYVIWYKFSKQYTN